MGVVMKVFCEEVATHVLPAVRALMAIDLIKRHKMKQVEACKIMGVTQPAISQYLRGIRGKKIAPIKKNKRVMAEIAKCAQEIATKKVSPTQWSAMLCGICTKMKDEGMLDEAHYPYGHCLK
jgi:predicted transcriptional regulator